MGGGRDAFEAELEYKNNYMTDIGTAVDRMTAPTTDWVAPSGCTLTEDTSVIKDNLGCSKSLKVTSTNTSFLTFNRNITPIIFTGAIGVWVYFPKEPLPTLIMNVRFSNDALAGTTFSGTKYQFAQFLGGPGGTRHIRQGWNCLLVHVAEDGTTGVNNQNFVGSAIGGNTMASAISSIMITTANLTAGDVYHVGGIFFGAKSQAKVMFTWDDGNDTQWDIFNIFRSRGIVGSVSIIPRKIGKSGSLTLAQLKVMYSWGWDVVAHPHPVDDLNNLLAETDEGARAYITECRDWLSSNGFIKRLDTMVWPQNATDAAKTAVARSEGYSIARESTNRNMGLAQGIDNPMRLGSGDLGGKTLAQALKMLDMAELYSCLVIIYGHKMVGTDTSPASGGAAPGDTYTWNRSDYLALVDNLAARVKAGTIEAINWSMLSKNCFT